MSKKEEKRNVEQEESAMTLPEDTGAEEVVLTEEQEAIEAIRKFTNEDEDDLGEISVKSILGGDFLMSKFMVKQIMFVMFCVLLMILYTGNRYDSQQDAILIDSLRGRLQEVKYNVLTQSSELMNLTRQSNVEKMLKSTPDSLLHNSITPPYLIKQNDRRSVADEEKVEEVLVDSSELVAAQEQQDATKKGQVEKKKTEEKPTENQSAEQKKEDSGEVAGETENKKNGVTETGAQNPVKTEGQ
ncbi:MAG: hypothetical protein IJP75_09990 [Bacteroidaceae bacterium]|nr:hypothetical protein [Bacteroidaceae bacterium]